MRHRLLDLTGLSDDQLLELETIIRRPAGARFASLLSNHLRGAPQLVEHLATKREPARKSTAERVAESRARRRANTPPTPKET